VGLVAKRIFMGLCGRSMILSENGELFGIEDANRSSENAAFPRLDFNFSNNDSAKEKNYWTFATGGILADVLFGVANDGSIWQAKYVDQENETWHNPKLVPTRIAGAETYKMQEIREGTTFRSLLTSDGQIIVQRYRDSAATLISTRFVDPQEKFVELAIVQRTKPTEALVPLRALDSRFAEACGVENPQVDPWGGIGMGLNQGGILIFGLLASNGTIACHAWQLPSIGPLRSIAQVSKDEGLLLVATSGKKYLARPYQTIGTSP
jgi:hypothetical protein